MSRWFARWAVASSALLSLRVEAQEAAPRLSLPADTPQMAGRFATPADDGGPPSPPASSDWRFWVGGYFQAPLRMSWGPPTTADPSGANPGTQLRTPPLVPDADAGDWRTTGSLVAPWTELDFHFGNDRVRAVVQLASATLTDAGYRRLEANLGINQAYLELRYPAPATSNVRLTLLAGGFTSRYGAAGRDDAGRYGTYIVGRTHVAGEAATLEVDAGQWTLTFEEGFGAKLEPVPFYSAPIAGRPPSLPIWEPNPGPVPQESALVAHAHAGVTFRRALLVGLHAVHVFANDDERSSAFHGPPYAISPNGRPANVAAPRITVLGADLKLRGGALGDGYLGYSHLDAENAQYLGDALEVLHAAGGWQLHDNYFGTPGGSEPATGRIDTVEVQHVLGVRRLVSGGRASPGPDLVAAVFGMWNRVSGTAGGAFDRTKLKLGGDLTYLPLAWLGLGGRFDLVQPDLANSDRSFSVGALRLLLRTAFLTREQVVVQWAHYWYGADYAPGNPLGGSTYPYDGRTTPASAALGVDRNALQIAGIIWF